MKISEHDNNMPEPIDNSWEHWFASFTQFSDGFMADGREQASACGMPFREHVTINSKPKPGRRNGKK